MTQAIHVARYLIELAAEEDEPDYLSHLRLQKLLYYVQAWSLVQRGKPMFPERIEAWPNGPIVRDLYPTFARYGHNSIPPENTECGAADELTDEEQTLIGSVWDSYKHYSATSLRSMTHEEAPWVDARKGYGPADRCEVEITPAAMLSYFSQQIA